MFQKTTTLCCSGPRCPVVTQIDANSYNVADDYGNTETLSAADLNQLAALGERHNGTVTVRFRNLQMLAEQARLARKAI